MSESRALPNQCSQGSVVEPIAPVALKAREVLARRESTCQSRGQCVAAVDNDGCELPTLLGDVPQHTIRHHGPMVQPDRLEPWAAVGDRRHEFFTEVPAEAIRHLVPFVVGAIDGEVLQAAASHDADGGSAQVAGHCQCDRLDA